MMEKKSYLMVGLTGLLLAIGGVGVAQHYNKQSEQIAIEQGELMNAVVHEVGADDSIRAEDIEVFIVLESKAGTPPFNYDIAVNLKDGTQILYSWSDKEKTGVERIN
jgi:hypothetical protein